MTGERKTSLTFDEVLRRKTEQALGSVQLDLSVARIHVEEEERDRKVAEAIEDLETSRLIGFGL